MYLSLYTLCKVLYKDVSWGTTRNWSLITGREGGYKTEGGGGACEVLTLRKRGEGGKSFSHAEGGGCTKSFGVVFTR